MEKPAACHGGENMSSGTLRHWALAAPIAAIAAAATPAHAERLSFDHRLYPQLKAALDSGNGALVHYEGGNPKYLYNFIVVQGTSYARWTEGLEIITRLPARNMQTARDWLAELQAKLPRGCSAEVTVISEDATSLTFERRLSRCPANMAQSGLYRIVAGRRSLFLLGAHYKGEMTADMRSRWLALLASANLN
jgi:hypothetical protein